MHDHLTLNHLLIPMTSIMRNLILTLGTSIFATTLMLLLFIPPDRWTILPATSPLPLTIERVQALGTLVTTRVTVRVECTERRVGYLGGLTTTWRGSGSVLIGPDLRTAELLARNEAAHTVTVLLPEPTVLEKTLSLSTGRVTVELEGLWQAAPDERLLAVEQQRLLERAQRALVDGITAEHRAASKPSAEAILQRLGRSLGWTLFVRWQAEPPGQPLSTQPASTATPFALEHPMSDPAMTDRLIRFASTDSHVLVIPSDDGQPFPVPHFPMSQFVWLDHLTTAFHKRHRRCLCIALMLDISTRTWSQPEVPTQHCGPEGVRWTWNPEDFTHRSPAMFIGGTFQSAVLDDINESISIVPLYDGVHFVAVKALQPGIRAFVHANGQTMAIDARRLVVDDIVAGLTASADRLTFN